MDTASTDAANLEGILYSHPAAIVRRTPWRLRTQFWTSVAMCSFLLIHGAWLLVRVRHLPAESLVRSGCVMIAIVYGMTLPSFIYFARKAWKSRTERPLQSIDDLG